MVSQLNKSNDNIALFGTGCFWEGESAFMNIRGIIKTEVGYATDGSNNRKLLIKRKNNIEVVRVTYNPEVTSYDELLEVFWNTHDPTDKQHLNKSNGERAVIFYINPEQKLKKKKKNKTKQAKTKRLQEQEPKLELDLSKISSEVTAHVSGSSTKNNRINAVNQREKLPVATNLSVSSARTKGRGITGGRPCEPSLNMRNTSPMPHLSLKKDNQPGNRVIGQVKARKKKDLVPGTREA